MYIVNLEKFRALPEGTIFCKYRPCVFGDLCVKGDTWEYDFIYTPLVASLECKGTDEMFDILDRAEKTGSNFSLDVDSYQRDGYFEENQLYAIYEKDDISQLIDKLKKSI